MIIKAATPIASWTSVAEDRAAADLTCVSIWRTPQALTLFRVNALFSFIAGLVKNFLRTFENISRSTIVKTPLTH
jgi:hypothetical protein